MRVTDSAPAASPRLWLPPKWIGTRPFRLGSANVVTPLPPYRVPSRAKSAWFWLIGRNWPLHMAQPFGTWLNANSLISDRNGSDMCVSLSVPRQGQVAPVPEKVAGGLAVAVPWAPPPICDSA